MGVVHVREIRKSHMDIIWTARGIVLEFWEEGPDFEIPWFSLA
jgi:hypothetical protein